MMETIKAIVKKYGLYAFIIGVLIGVRVAQKQKSMTVKDRIEKAFDIKTY
jgi:hypothetical protein